jgi:hypothetical protein
MLKDAGAVLIDRSGDKVKCYVGPGKAKKDNSTLPDGG